jgi:hypothetical protein
MHTWVPRQEKENGFFLSVLGVRSKAVRVLPFTAIRTFFGKAVFCGKGLSLFFFVKTPSLTA